MMKSPSIILTLTTLLSVSTICLADFVASENATGPMEIKIEIPDTMMNSTNSANYSTADMSFYVREFMKTMKNQQLASGGNPKKAYYAQVSNKTEINSFGELVRYVLNSRAAPAIKTVFSNLDRDLFKLFTPSDSGKGIITDERLNLIIQHQYPTEEPSSTTPGSTPTTTKSAIRNLEEGDGDDEEEGDDDLVSKHSSPVGSKYKVSAKVKKTTPIPTIDQEDDEDETHVFNNLKKLEPSDI